MSLARNSSLFMASTRPGVPGPARWRKVIHITYSYRSHQLRGMESYLLRKVPITKQIGETGGLEVL